MEPRVFDSRVDLGLDLFHTTAEFSTWESRRTGFATRLSAPLRYINLPYIGRHADRRRQDDFDDEPQFSILDHLHGGVGYTLARNKITNVQSKRSVEHHTGRYRHQRHYTAPLV